MIAVSVFFFFLMYLLAFFAVILGLGPQQTFTYSELRAATEDFSFSNKIGEGGFGNVYKVNLILHKDFYHELISSY